jgi:hypothetical protein
MKAEIRGRGRKWRVFYPDEAGLASPLPIFDRDGNLKAVVEVGAPTGNMVEAYASPLQSQAEADEYARYLGADEVVVVKTATRNEALKKARAARRAA